MTVEDHFSEAVDLLAADPNLKVDLRAWRQLWIYAPEQIKLNDALIEQCARVAAAAIRALKDKP